MKLLILILKNALVTWWRTLTLGFLMFTAGFVAVVFGSFSQAVQNKVESTITSGITRDVQIRSQSSFEVDMAEHYGKGWDSLAPISEATVKTLQSLLTRDFPRAEYTRTVRRSAFLEGGGTREEIMLLGIQPEEFSSYREAFLLSEGRYLSPFRQGEILLTEEQAAEFGLSPGDRVRVSTKNRYGLNSGMELTVSGTGNFVMLSLFSYKAGYLHADDVRTLADMSRGEATDILISLPEGRQALSFTRDLARSLEAAGIENVLTSEEKLKSSDLMVKEFDLDEAEEDDGAVKISTAGEMGKSFRSVGGIMFVTLNVLIVFLMIIVSILIMNLVYMMGIERYREIGTMRTLGFSRRTVIGIFMGEILTITVVFGLLGIIGAAAGILLFGSRGIPSPVPAMDFIMGKTLFLDVSLLPILSAAAVILFFSLAASFYPAYRACSVEPSRALRSER